MSPRYEQQMRAADILAVNSHREQFLAGEVPSYLDETVYFDGTSVAPAESTEIGSAPAELGTDVQSGVRAALASTFIGSRLGLSRLF